MIFLSAGHSTVDPGAVTKVKDVNGKLVERKEADVVAEFRNMVSFYLERAKVEHKVDGVGSENVPLSEAIKSARNCRPSLEFHCNAGPVAATGVETLQQARDQELGEALCAALAEALKIRNRGAKAENSGQHHRLAFVQAGGIIVELFFISNPADLAAYDARKWLAAQAVANVLMGWEAK